MNDPKMSQEDYLQILFDELGYNLKQRNYWCSAYVHRPIKHLDGMTKSEKHSIIETLKKKRAEKRHQEDWLRQAGADRDDE